MKILGIETSCDETAVCIIDGQGNFGTDFKFEILGNALYSQIAIHAPYGGVFPNLARREHAKNLVPFLTQALEQSFQLSGFSVQEKPGNSSPTESWQLKAESVRVVLEREPELLEQLENFLAKYPKPAIDAIAVTYGPGLEPALWVGVNFARALSIVWDIPLVAVNHMEGHIMMSMIKQREVISGQKSLDRETKVLQESTDHYSLSTINFPLLSLLISGGHTELVLSREWQQYEVIGQTRDDAVGEAFDKVARLVGLPYPGGPEISRLAAQARILPQDEASGISFTPPMLHSGDLDFSFSGIKTEVRKYVESLERKAQRGSTSLARLNLAGGLNNETKGAVARAFEDAVAKVLIAKTLRAVDEFDIQTVIVGGGVSANTYIRLRLAEALAEAGQVKLLVPPPDLATDNAVMIALAGYFHAIKKDYADPATLRANGNLKLA